MTRKRKKALPCPFCGSATHIAEVTSGRTGKVRYAVVCDGECRLSEPPFLKYCHDDEDAATDAWNGRAR